MSDNNIHLRDSISEEIDEISCLRKLIYKEMDHLDVYNYQTTEAATANMVRELCDNMENHLNALKNKIRDAEW